MNSFFIDKKMQGTDNLKEIFIGIALAFVLMIILMICFILWYKRRLKKRHAAYLKPNANFVVSFIEFLNTYSIVESIRSELFKL